MRCPRCGNDNQDGMRFCGMCGGTLLPSPPPPKPVRGTAPEPSRPATATVTRVPEEPRVVDSSPSISGPSFLGLGDTPASRKRANLGADPHHSGPRNLDYLLDDEEPHRGGGGAGKFLFIVFALLLAAGLGYLRWKNQLPPWLNAIAKKPAAATQTTDQPAPDSTTPASPSTTPEAQPTPNQTAANPSVASPPASTPTASAQPAAAPSTNPAATNQQPPSDSSAAKTDSGNTAGNVAPEAKTPPSTDESANSKGSTPAAKSDDSNDDADSSAAPAETAPKAKAAPPPAPKPRAASKPVDSVADAQRYLYGRGAAQDCDRGLRILKPLATEGNAKAMVEMGALYSAGLCAPHDLPTAYRWFAIALRKDPSNQAIQTDLQKLWGEMTQPERQLAIKLTQ